MLLTNRWDETWHRLREWTNGQGQSERLAAQILLYEDYKGLDPSHPLGGEDGTKDAVCRKDDKKWLMAVYFPRRKQSFNSIKKKFLNDLSGVASNKADAITFVTNQELRLAEREALKKAAGAVFVELYHLERITTILDTPAMASVRKQFLGIDFTEETLRLEVASVKDEIVRMQRHIEGVQTGGDTFCYCMLYHFDLIKNVAQQFVVIRRGEYSLYDVRFRIWNVDTSKDILNRQWGEINSPADYLPVKWSLAPSVYYRVFFHARNGMWTQDLMLKCSPSVGGWFAATRVLTRAGETRFEHIDNGFITEFGEPTWRP